jgi:hypothetical protein
MVSVLALSAVDRGFEPQLGQTKDYQIDMWILYSKWPLAQDKVLA